MKSLKTSWYFSLKEPGFYLLLALAAVALSFLIYQAQSLAQKIIACAVLAYFLFLLLKKFQQFKWLLVIVLSCFLLLAFLNRQRQEPDLRQPCVIYPDQVKVQDKFVSGQAKIGKTKVSFTATANSQLLLQLKNQKSIYLTHLQGEVTPIAGPTNPGETDFRKYYADKNIYYQIKITNYQLAEKRQTLLDQFHSLRAQLQAYCQKLPQQTSFMISEMLLAENPNSTNQTTLNDYRDLGVIHLLSISGLHVGLYTMFIGLVCTYFKRTEKETFIICLLFLLLEIFLANFQPGFVRASFSFLLGKIFSFKRIPVSQGDVLGLTALCHLFWQPNLFLNIGAVLSYLLVLGLELTRDFSQLKQGLALNWLITPILLSTFYRVNLLTILYNFLIVPIFNFILLPLTFIALVANFCSQSLLNFCEQLFKIVLVLIHQLASLKLGLLTFGQLNWWQTFLLLVLTATLIINPQIRILHFKMLTWLFISYLLFYCHWHYPLTGQVAFIDVGQGDSILITTPFKRHCYLIDTGGKLNFGKKKRTPQLNRITLPYLYSQGIDHLDAVFLSHQDADHVGDLRPLLEQMPVDRLYFAQGLTDNPSFRKRIQGCIQKTKLCPVLAGDVINEPHFKAQVVYPVSPGLGKNEDSLSLYFELAHKKWLFTGDLDRTGELNILEHYPLQVDYFKLGHHGSKTASDPTFLQAIKPEMVFISSGRKNRFGHPHPETMQTLKEQGLPYLNTQDSGTITWIYSDFGLTKFTTFLRK